MICVKAHEAQALKEYCIECSGSKTQAKQCQVTNCKLWKLLPDWHHERRKKSEKVADGVQVRMVIRQTTVVEVK